MGDVTKFTGENVRPYPHLDELSNKINDAINEYGGKVPTAQVIGILEMIKIDLYLYSQEVDES